MHCVSRLPRLAVVTLIAVGLLFCSVLPPTTAMSAVRLPDLPKGSLVQPVDCTRYCVRWVLCYTPTNCVPCPDPCRSWFKHTCAEWKTACLPGHPRYRF
jgi:hypothetical protein